MLKQQTSISLVVFILKHLVLFIGAFVMIVPFFWMVSSSLMTAGEIVLQPPVFFPKEPQLDNYRRLIDAVPFERMYLNSIIVTGTTVAAVLFTSSLAGYGFAKFQFPGRTFLFYFILATMMVPFFVNLIPVFYIVRQFGWVDKYLGLIAPTVVAPYGIFLMRQFIASIPDELIDAARVDGASEPLIYWRIILPLVQPALATLGILTFITSWNDFLWPLVVVNSREMMTIQLGLDSLRLYADDADTLNLLMAGINVAVLPILLLFIFLQRYFIRGIALTGLKG